MISIRMFTRDTCQPCKAAKRWFKERGLEVEEIDVDSEEGAIAVSKHHIRTLPFTVIGDSPVSGFAPTKFKQYLEDYGVPV